MPGQAKTVSTTIATLIIRTRLIPASVSTGISAFLSACLAMTNASGSPLMRASFTYSEPRTSSMDERVSRMCAAAKYQPSANAGMSTCAAVPEPEEGEELARAVPPAVHPHRRDDARRDPDHEREEHRDRREQKGVGQARAVELEDVGPVVERLAEVAASEMGEEAPVLHPERLVEAELLPDRRQVVGARPGLGEEHGRVAGDAHEDEDRQREEEERDEGEAHALHDESPHGVTARGAWPRSARRRAGLRPSVVGRLMDVLPGREVA